MAEFIELHRYDSSNSNSNSIGIPSRRVSINLDAISQIGEVGGIQTHVPAHGIVIRVDGGSVETIETYDQIVKAVSSADLLVQVGHPRDQNRADA